MQNSIFNEYYLDKSSSATRLNVSYLFKKTKFHYSKDELLKLKPQDFTKANGQIKRNVPCILAPTNKILCGPLIYEKLLTVDGTKKSIQEVLGKQNINNLKKASMGIASKGRVIESALSMTIKSITKNDKIFEEMLEHGFSFKDFYDSIGRGFLEKNYEANIIVPVLDKKSFYEYYPFAKEEGDAAYAGYIKNLVNSPPQYLNKIGPVYLSRATPDMQVEVGLTKIFPLPMTEPLMEFLAKNDGPNVKSIIRNLPAKILNKPENKVLKEKALIARSIDSVVALDRDDVKYLEQMKRLDGQIEASIESGFSSSGYKPTNTMIKATTTKALKSAINIEKVSGISPKTPKLGGELPTPNPVIISRLDKIENFIAATSYNNKKKLAKLTVKSGNYSKSERKAVYKALVATPLVLDDTGNPAVEAREYIRRYDKMRAERRRKARGKVEVPFLKEAFENKNVVFLANSHFQTQSNKNFDSSNPISKKVKFKTPRAPGNNPIPRPEKFDSSPNNPIEIYNRSEVSSNFICKINDLDNLFSTYKKHSEKSSPHYYNLDESFCNSGQSLNLPEFRNILPTLEYYSRCQTSDQKSSFKDLLDEGIDASSCNKREFKSSCRSRLANDIVKLCNKFTFPNFEILKAEGQELYLDKFRGFLKTCERKAHSLHGLPLSTKNMLNSMEKKLNTFKSLSKNLCSNFSKRSSKMFLKNLNKNGNQFTDAEKYKIKEEIKNANQENICETLDSLTHYLIGPSRDSLNKKKKLVTISLSIAKSPIDEWTDIQSAAWLLTEEHYQKIVNLIDSCRTINNRNSNVDKLNVQ